MIVCTHNSIVIQSINGTIVIGVRGCRGTLQLVRRVLIAIHTDFDETDEDDDCGDEQNDKGVPIGKSLVHSQITHLLLL